MNYQLEFSTEAQKIIAKWKKSNPSAFKKLYNLLPELEKHPRSGTGHPEALKGGQGITYSRHLTARDRIIYDIYENTVTVLVITLEGHYNDK